MKSKHFQTLILLLIFVNFSNAQEKMYKIQFALHMGGVAEAESVADLYSTRDFLRVENKFMDKTVQISDFNKHKAYTLDYDNENYYEEELLSGKLTVTDTEDPISTADLQVEFITGESKSIAGYNCNKAIITLPIETEEGNPIIEVWYTKALPKMYWGEYGYLEKIPGAALSISAYEMGIQAFKVTASEINPSLFEIPADFELIEKAEEQFTFEPTQLDENRVSYFDENTGYIGISDEDGHQVTPAKYSIIHEYIAGYAVAVDSNNSYGLLNLEGKEVIPCQYEHLARTEDGPLLFSKNDQYGFMDTNAHIIIPALYSYAREFDNEHAIVTTKTGSGVIDRTGKIIIPTKFELIHEFQNGTAVISEEELYYLVDHQEKKLSAAFEFITNGGENLWLCMQNEKYGFIDLKGKPVTPIKYQYAAPFDSGLSLVSENGEDFFYIDHKGKFVQKMETE